MEINRIHSEFHNLLHNFIASRLRNKEDADDILQEVFIKIAAKINSLENGEKLKSWIFSITRNTIIDYYRKNSRNKTSDINENILEIIPEEQEADSTKGLDTCLTGFIEKLPSDYRDIIIDSELKGIKQKDLAEKYDLAYSSVRSRVQRGRGRLKEMLLQCCKIETDMLGNILEATSRNPKENNCGKNCG
jgi:RNA polymerase sigma-70 factor, ECF subfamily